MERSIGRSRVVTTRISVSFPADATDWLLDEANKRGITVGEVVRRIVDEVRHNDQQLRERQVRYAR